MHGKVEVDISNYTCINRESYVKSQIITRVLITGITRKLCTQIEYSSIAAINTNNYTVINHGYYVLKLSVDSITEFT